MPLDPTAEPAALHTTDDMDEESTMQMTTDSPAVDWTAWLERWDAQQTLYIEDRERVFEVMFNFVDAMAPEDPVILDLAAGPGAISQRVLQRFPRARCVAVDTDPVLLGLGQGALGDQDGRLRWVRADFRDPDWVQSLGEKHFDAILSTTATHWLLGHELAHLYRDLAGLLSPSGIFLNGDGMYFPRHQPRLRAAVAQVDESRQERAARDGAENWTQWWEGLRSEPSLETAFEERDRIFPGPRRHGGETPPTCGFHEAALLDAGFEEVGPVWQDLHKRIVLALR